MELPSTEVQNLMSLIAGAIFGYIVKREKRILKLESMVREIRKDIKGVALFIGTPRAKAEQLALEMKLKASGLGVDSEQDELDPLSISDDDRKEIKSKSKGASMKDTIINILKSLWANHKKKVLAFIFGLLLSGLAAVSGLSVDEIKEAAHEASKPAVTSPAPASLPALEEK